MRFICAVICILGAVMPGGLAAATAAAAGAPAAAGGFAFAAAQAGVPGRPAPHFELPELDADGRVSSGQLFASHARTFVVFWSSRCPACIESLRESQRFHARVAGGDINIVGINGDDRDDLAVRGAVAAAGVRFLQLRDRGGAVTARYGVPASSFAVFLVDDGGMVLARVVDPREDAGLMMERMLLGLAHDESGDAADPFEEPPRVERRVAAPLVEIGDEAGLVFKADARIKFFSADMRGADARGPYGERIDPGNSLLQRFTLEATGRINRHLSAGGILRAGNEGLEVLRSGPEYFDSEWGSAFVLIEAGRMSARLGYFSLHMTPLTLMRWDWDDSPRTGGATGCDCGGAAGVLTVRSLEELGPDLTFEGGLGRYSRGEFDADLFYAMPRRARYTRAVVWQYGGEERAAYSSEIYGLQARWRRHDSRTGRFWGAGLHLLGHREDPRSIDRQALGYGYMERYTGHILAATTEVPLAAGAGLRGEWIASCRAKGYEIGGPDGQIELDGSGGSAGIVFEGRGPLEMRLDYLRLGEDFYSPFAALTYAAGRHGMRASADLRLPGGWSTLSLFYKRMRGTGAPAGAEKDQLSFAGVTIDLEHPRGPGGSISYLDQGEWRLGDVERFEDYRRTFTAGLRHQFARQASIEALYQRTLGETGGGAKLDESRTDIYSLSLRAGF